LQYGLRDFAFKGTGAAIICFFRDIKIAGLICLDILKQISRLTFAVRNFTHRYLIVYSGFAEIALGDANPNTSLFCRCFFKRSVPSPLFFTRLLKYINPFVIANIFSINLQTQQE